MDSQSAYPVVEFVGEESTKEHTLPVELNDEPYMLVEWASDSYRRRSGRYSFPPGIALLALVASAALSFFLMKMYGLFERRPKLAPDGGIDSTTELEDALSAPSYISSIAQRSAALQSRLERVASNMKDAQKELKKKKKAALAALEKATSKEGYAEAVKTLEELTDMFIGTFQALIDASGAMGESLSDSQSAMAFNAVKKQLELVEIPADRVIWDAFEFVEQALQSAGHAIEEEASEHAHLSDWLAALQRQHILLVDSRSSVLNTAAEWHADLDLLH